MNYKGVRIITNVYFDQPSVVEVGKDSKENKLEHGKLVTCTLATLLKNYNEWSQQYACEQQ